MARTAGVDPIGTAPGGGILILEWPRPWPAKIGEIAKLGPVVQRLRDRDVKMRLAVPAGDNGELRLLLARPFRCPVGFRRFERRMATSSDATLADAVDALLSGDGQEVPNRVKDVLVCTHGSRDVCCGSQGTKLAASLPEADLNTDTDGFRVWRTSHAGGHRFAPTVTLLPAGTSWAWMDSTSVEAALHGQLSVEDAYGRYRGCGALGDSPVQLLERSVLAHTGFGLFDWHRRGGHAGNRVWLEALTEDGRHMRWEGIFGTSSTVPVHVCGEAPDPASIEHIAENAIQAFEEHCLSDGFEAAVHCTCPRSVA